MRVSRFVLLLAEPVGKASADSRFCLQELREEQFPHKQVHMWVREKSLRWLFPKKARTKSTGASLEM